MTIHQFNRFISLISGSIRYAMLVIVILACLISGCKKWVAVDPPFTSTNAENAFTSDASSIAIMTGIYTKLSQGNIVTGSAGLSFYCGLSADELNLFSGATNVAQQSYYSNALSVNSGGFEFWSGIYNYIFKCNSVIGGLSGATGVTPAVSKQLLGEAKFIRAFCYFYLVNLYGDAPLVLSTDYKANSTLARAPKDSIYRQIVSDLKDAQGLLSDSYLDGTLLKTTTERVRPTTWAATALLARVYLYMGDYTDAEAQSTAVIGHSASYSLSPLAGVFLKNSNEAIWQLQPVNTGWNTEDARLFVLTGAPNASTPAYLSPFLLSDFDSADKRRSVWVHDTTVNSVTYSYPFKYRVATAGAAVTEYLMVLRLGEQYLIRAESRAEQNNLAGADADLNVIRNRAGLFNDSSADKNSLLHVLFHERRIELFTELGHRWLDLKRSGNIDAVMGTISPNKGGSWNTDWQWYPLPSGDLQQDPHLVQNAGY